MTNIDVYTLSELWLLPPRIFNLNTSQVCPIDPFQPTAKTSLGSTMSNQIHFAMQSLRFNLLRRTTLEVGARPLLPFSHCEHGPSTCSQALPHLQKPFRCLATFPSLLILRIRRSRVPLGEPFHGVADRYPPGASAPYCHISSRVYKCKQNYLTRISTY